MIQLGKYSTWMAVGFFWLAMIGVGSFLFHGTMRLSMQLLDEGPMVLFAGTGLLWKVDKHHWTYNNATFYHTLLGLVYLAVLWTYVWLDMYELFVHGFTALVLVDLAFSYSWNEGNRSARDKGLIFVLLGKILWEIENRACESFPQVWVLHVCWHLLSAISAYYGMLYNVSLVLLKKHKRKTV